MKPIFSLHITALCLILLFSACRVEKNNYQILKRSKPDTSTRQLNYGSVKKTIVKMNKIERSGFLFDQYIADNFHLPKNKRDSAIIVKYFIETSFAQLGRREFRQWDLVVIRDVLFQINVEKKNPIGMPLFKNQSKIEILGMLLLLLGVYFF